jgi:hypothetical protein
MKKTFILFLLIAVVSSTYSSTSTTPVSSTNPSIKATDVYVPIGKNGQLISLMDLSEISVKDFEKFVWQENEIHGEGEFQNEAEGAEKKYKL